MSKALTPSDLKDILAFVVKIARKAGDLILEGSESIAKAAASDIGEKKNSVDLVTEFDVKTEDLVRREIASAYPNFGFIGEESYSSGTRPALTSSPTFCVDPIDGTTNFVHGFPFACISIGLIDQKRPVLGVVFNPFLDHLYTGVTGQGSYLIRSGGAPQKLPLLGIRPFPSLSQALIGVEWGSDRKVPIISKKAESFLRLAGDPENGIEKGRMAHSLRSLGSAALNISMVAQGGLDIYWEIGCWAWDVCAGIVILQEAGGFVTGSKDSPHDGNVTEEVLLGRKYLFIRAIADSTNESKIEAQKRLTVEFYDTVEDFQVDAS